MNSINKQLNKAEKQKKSKLKDLQAVQAHSEDISTKMQAKLAKAEKAVMPMPSNVPQ